MAVPARAQRPNHVSEPAGQVGEFEAEVQGEAFVAVFQVGGGELFDALEAVVERGPVQAQYPGGGDGAAGEAEVGFQGFQ